MKFSETNLAKSGLKNEYNALNNNQKARFRNFKNRYMWGYKNIYNQLMREKEHNYNQYEKGNVHHFIKTHHLSVRQAHNKIMSMRESAKKFVPIPGFGQSYMQNR
jgi:predicted enzyme involved in methoxymalonyl-ACP biosynthesis